MQKPGKGRLNLLLQASQQGMVGLGLESGQWTSQPGAPLRPYALSQGRDFTEATLSPFPLPTLTPLPSPSGIVCGQY